MTKKQRNERAQLIINSAAATAMAFQKTPLKKLFRAQLAAAVSPAFEANDENVTFPIVAKMSLELADEIIKQAGL